MARSKRAKRSYLSSVSFPVLFNKISSSSCPLTLFSSLHTYILKQSAN